MKEGIDKLSGLFNILRSNRKERKTANPTSTSIPTCDTPNVATKELITALKETSANRESANTVLEALGKVRTEVNRFGDHAQESVLGTDASPWSEVVIRGNKRTKKVNTLDLPKDKAPRVPRARPAALLVNRY